VRPGIAIKTEDAKERRRREGIAFIHSLSSLVGAPHKPVKC